MNIFQHILSHILPQHYKNKAQIRFALMRSIVSLIKQLKRRFYSPCNTAFKRLKG